MSSILESIYNGLVQTTWIEAIAVISGIVSVWYSRKENILVFPTGLLNTTIYIYLSFKVQSLTNIKSAIKCWNNDIIPIQSFSNSLNKMN